MSYHAFAVTVTLDVAGTAWDSDSFRWSALPVHQAYWPEGGVTYVFVTVFDGRPTLIACAFGALASWAGSSWNVSLWPKPTSR